MTAIASPTDRVPGDTVARIGATFGATAFQTARRTTLQFVRTSQLLMTGTISGALYLFMFRYVLGGAIDTGGSTAYVQYLVPGFLVTMILWNGMAVPAGIAEDAASGVYDRLRSLPIPRAAVMLGRALADTALIGWGLFVTTLFAIVVGFRFEAGVGDVALGCGVLLLAAFALSWLFITLGLVAGSAQAAQGMSMLAIPLVFISSAYVPADSMPGWMQPIADHQPITVLSNAVRSLMLDGTGPAGVGHSTGYWVGLSVVWCTGIVVVLGSLATSRFARTR